MRLLNISKAHPPQLEQLTGCRYAVLLRLAGQVREHLTVQRRGRSFKHSVLVMTVLALMKLRCNLSVRTMEALTAVDAVTVARCVNHVVAALSLLPLAAKVRVKVEHVFARLKTLRALAGIFPYRWQRLGEVVRALAVVHNLNREIAGVQR